MSFDIANFIFGSFDVVYGVLGKIFWWGLIPLAGVVMRLIGGIMDYALNVSVLASLYNNEAISIAWTVIRDITNMIFIFVLIFNGIKTILNIGNASVIKKTIINVVIAALLLNFSLFFSKVLIDTSNITASWFIQGIQRIGGQDSVSSSIRATLEMEKLTGTYGNAHLDLKSFSLTSFNQGILLFILMCVAIYVLYKIADLIIGRIVAFIILLITSPLGFTGIFLELGDLTTYAKKWWKEMMGQVFMLPMFFLMLYITMFLVDRFDKLFATTNASVNDGFEPVNYLMFIIIIMLLLKSLKVAEEYSGEIGTGFAKIAQQATGVALGGIAMGTIGKATTILQKSDRFQNWQAKSGVVGEIANRAALGVSGASFGVKSNFSGIAKSVGISDKTPVIGQSFKGADKGYAGKIEQEKKDLKEYTKSFGKGLPGALRREAYVKNLQTGLYARVFKTGAGGAVAGAALGSMAGPMGAVAGAAIGGYFSKKLTNNKRFDQDIAQNIASGYNQMKEDISNVGPRTAGVVEILDTMPQNQGLAGAKKEMADEVNDELAKESMKRAQTALDIVNDVMNDKRTDEQLKNESDRNSDEAKKVADTHYSEKTKIIDTHNEDINKATKAHNEGLEKMKENLEEVSEKLKTASENASKLTDAEKGVIESLKKEEAKLAEHLASFNEKNHTMGGIELGPQVFAQQKADAENKLRISREEILQKSKPKETEEIKTLEKEQRRIEKELEEKDKRFKEEKINREKELNEKIAKKEKIFNEQQQKYKAKELEIKAKREKRAQLVENQIAELDKAGVPDSYEEFVGPGKKKTVKYEAGETRLHQTIARGKNKMDQETAAKIAKLAADSEEKGKEPKESGDSKGGDGKDKK